MSEFYWRPIPVSEGALPLAGGWLRFDHVERLSRHAPPQILPASAAPADVLARLTTPRPPIMGLALDRPLIMGVVNATPDSFSDGGLHQPLPRGTALIEQGADLLDIGGESTRPGAADISEADELSRILPTITALSSRCPISVDTRKAGVAGPAIRAGAGMVNDVSGLDFDPALAGVVADRGVALCLMHAQGVPATMQNDPRYDDVLLDVYDALHERLNRTLAAGVPRARIVLDPGIGFGKTTAHNLAILARIGLFHALGCPVLLGVSRKRFIGEIGQAPDPLDRAPGTLALTLAAVAQGVQMHRVHDVAVVRQGLALWRAVTERTEAGS
ncbi:dihydropteroate synthase [Paracoccus jeotgali]|uniref:dihydropteroate synthase n=1 Tax=Paracoccus jeotgali TaxID=2065379 RepID=UPI0028AD7D31|nr:dihydropteroate synthase [Paracoccus jeotgali]